ncbi:MAG: GNAT family protein [Dermabacter sp.]|nr:GNAT family protein [Dermabacter sp.]
MNDATEILRTDRLRLRLYGPGDAEWMHALYRQDSVARYLLEGPWSAEDAEERLRERRERTGLDTEAKALAMVVEHEGVPVGDVSLWWTDADHRIVEIGWVLDPAHAGHGFASEAVSAALALAFGTYRAHRVAAQMDARNTRSAALAERVGMTREAHLRQDWWSKGEWTDTVIFGALGTDDPHASITKKNSLSPVS